MFLVDTGNIKLKNYILSIIFLNNKITHFYNFINNKIYRTLKLNNYILK